MAHPTALAPLTRGNPPSTATKAKAIALAAGEILPSVPTGAVAVGALAGWQGLWNNKEWSALGLGNLAKGTFGMVVGLFAGAGMSPLVTVKRARRQMGAYSAINKGLSFKRDALEPLLACLSAMQSQGRVRTDASTGHTLVVVKREDLSRDEQRVHNTLADQDGDRLVDVTALLAAAKVRGESLLNRAVMKRSVVIKSHAKITASSSTGVAPRLVQSELGAVDKARLTIRIPAESLPLESASKVGVQLIHILDREFNAERSVSLRSA